ncbi:MAG: RsmB/NOP family class I SAM-dependent RNA methyltransferase [Firmicutes bacterium]|nr:RsmB/NOP family class I SAM-dependent RNA methyltransferase [Bacillota bacterium]
MDLPEKFVSRMKHMLGAEYDNFYKALCEKPIYSGIRINTLKDGARSAVFDELGELKGVKWCESGFYADKKTVSGKHPLHAAGAFYFQEPSAMSAVEALPVEPGDFVLDLCAAPGGKSTHAAAKLGGTGLLVANEIIKKRADILSENIERMGIKNAVVTNEPPQRLAEKYPRFFDKIIVDAPCSGEGMFRKEPQAVTEWSGEHALSCAERQKNILESAVKMLKPGGYLVYSTCTFSEEENEGAAEFLLNNYDMRLCEIPRLSMLSPGISTAAHDMTFARRIFPHLQKGEGHFAALFQYVGEGGEERAAKPKKTAVGDKRELYRAFESEFLNTKLDGVFTLFGDNLYLMPFDLDIDKIKVVRAGLHLGTLKKNRFEPSHALALALGADEIKYTVECDLETAQSYMRGEIIGCADRGWCAVTYKGFTLGWGKASNGALKNHYPKRLRIV